MSSHHGWPMYEKSTFKYNSSKGGFMRSRIIQAAAVIGMGLTAMATNVKAAGTWAAVSCEPVICVSQCPPFPQAFCEGWGCNNGGSCGTASCPPYELKVTCNP
jgi:hypothetical protein